MGRFFQWRVPMPPSRRPAILVALLAFSPGCTESPGELPKLGMVMNERGIISYYFEGEAQGPSTSAATSSGFVPVPPQIAAANRRGEDQVLQEIREHRRNLNDRITR